MASPISTQTITNATLASEQVLTVPAGTKLANIMAIGQNFNYSTDGTSPTTGVNGSGMKLLAGAQLSITAGLASIKFIREADTANSRLVVEYFGGAV